MSFFVQSLFYAIPAFAFLVFVEMLAARMMGVRVNRPADMISSLSSGLTNTIQGSLKYGVVLVSYSAMLPYLTVIELRPIWLAVAIAFLIEDFAGYWMHRLNHRVNVFWNRHVIHHSSEEFNLSCALRQSISQTFRFSAILYIPAAVLGVPAYIFAVLGPIHLFMQFWYHTQLIGKMGILEHFLVTPSHHRVHHAINPEYLDRNYGQIFIFWDKMFGSFQRELDDVKPVYGILRPARTWNPVVINFKHITQIARDAWHAKNFFDKLRIWFMPTGWRPDDVAQRFPLEQIEDPSKLVKYQTENSMPLVCWSWVQFAIAIVMMMHMFTVIPDYPLSQIYIYALFLFAHIFSFTSLLDGKWYAMLAEGLKIAVVYYFLDNFSGSWFGLSAGFTEALAYYLPLSIIVCYYFYKRELNKH